MNTTRGITSALGAATGFICATAIDQAAKAWAQFTAGVNAGWEATR